MGLSDRVDGQTTFGTPRIAGCLVAVNTKAGTASGIVLVSPDGTERVLYIDDTGDLKVGTRANFADANNAGTVVGSQS